MPVNETYHPLQKSLVRIFFAAESCPTLPCGAGVALLGNQVLTCAHVIASAMHLGRVIPNETPIGEIWVDFPLTASAKQVRTRVVFWDATADLAILEVLEPFPDEVGATKLLKTANLWEHKVQAFGFPVNHAKGAWGDGKLRGPNADGWLEIVDSQSTGYFIQEGFSGGPVWDETHRHCIGIIVATESETSLRTSYLIPAAAIAEKWLELPVERIDRAPGVRREAPPLLPYLVDRRAQEDKIRKMWANYLPDHPKPVVIVVHGDDCQAQDMFLARLQNDFIPNKLFKTGNLPITPLHLQWPVHMRQVGELKDRLTRSLADQILYNQDVSREHIQDHLARRNDVVMVHTHLLTDDWQQQGKGILEAYLDFWQGWPDLAPRQRLFAFLFMTHKIPAQNGFKKWLYQIQKQRIFAQLEHCAFHHYDRLIVDALPELSGISQAEVENWARDEACGYCGDDPTAVMKKIRLLYEKTMFYPMETLAEHLKGVLANGSA